MVVVVVGGLSLELVVVVIVVGLVEPVVVDVSLLDAVKDAV